MNISKTNTKNSDTNSYENYAVYYEISIWLNKFTSEATKSTYYSAVRNFLEFYDMQSTEDLSKTSIAEVIKWRDLMLKNTKSCSTINNKISALCSLFNHLREKQLIDILLLRVSLKGVQLFQ